MASETVDIAGIDKALLLMELWKGSHAQGMSYVALPSAEPDIRVFRRVVADNPCGYYDYVMGKVIKCDLSGDTLSPYLYDRDCGEGAAARAVAKAREACRNG